ncbi:RNA polymerase-binding protein RbpA [Motilibacter deserti]|uniref:RNA polymerase-binding protein RbpA n=1 Tax=Motilibacter deserti TaxID=2714956 RepID=A0ABX0GU58_9ACTN|nr:RNA polymerase-binding protein RbpA [Motilibacter deserti]NHC14332.1 RNA polymerase-binding protein RbpA [Motilibacter deserti]
MAERALRGSRLGAQSYESDTGVDAAPRQRVEYDCAAGHRTSVPFSTEAEVPLVWECRVCGQEALQVDASRPEPKRAKPPRTHWDMLMERRTVAELEELLAERLELLRARRGETTRKSA